MARWSLQSTLSAKAILAPFGTSARSRRAARRRGLRGFRCEPASNFDPARTARRYVVDHALTQRANLLVEHHAADRNNFEGFARSSSVRRSPKGVDQGETTFRIVTLA